MKKLYFILALLLIMCSVVSCGADKNSDKNITGYISVTDENGNIIETIIKNTNSAQIATTEAGVSASEKISEETTKTGKSEKTQKPKSDKEYVKELRVNYKGIDDMIKKISAYHTLDDVLKSGNIKDNYTFQTPFRQDKMQMFFDDMKFFVPYFPQGYTFKNCYLSAKGYLYFSITDKDQKSTYLKIYTSGENEEQNISRYTLSFKNSGGDDVYKNSKGKFCWYLDDKYIVEYGSKSKSFVNSVYIEAVNINPKLK